jgi:hypothetical protein
MKNTNTVRIGFDFTGELFVQIFSRVEAAFNKNLETAVGLKIGCYLNMPISSFLAKDKVESSSIKLLYHASPWVPIPGAVPPTGVRTDLQLEMRIGGAIVPLSVIVNRIHPGGGWDLSTYVNQFNSLNSWANRHYGIVVGYHQVVTPNPLVSCISLQKTAFKIIVTNVLALGAKLALSNRRLLDGLFTEKPPPCMDNPTFSSNNGLQVAVTLRCEISEGCKISSGF